MLTIHLGTVHGTWSNYLHIASAPHRQPCSRSRKANAVRYFASVHLRKTIGKERLPLRWGHEILPTERLQSHWHAYDDPKGRASCIWLGKLVMAKSGTQVGKLHCRLQFNGTLRLTLDSALGRTCMGRRRNSMTPCSDTMVVSSEMSALVFQ